MYYSKSCRGDYVPMWFAAAFSRASRLLTIYNRTVSGRVGMASHRVMVMSGSKVRVIEQEGLPRMERSDGR
jgi:hypothetical protein